MELPEALSTDNPGHAQTIYQVCDVAGPLHVAGCRAAVKPLPALHVVVHSSSSLFGGLHRVSGSRGSRQVSYC